MNQLQSSATHGERPEGEPAAPPYTPPGMPSLDMSGKQVSFFEFWPSWVMYFPVILQTLVLAVRYRSLTLPLLANPRLPLSGMVGVPKSQLLAQAEGACQQAILPWFLHTRNDTALDEQAADIEQHASKQALTYPMVCKPDIGCRGSGVKLVKDKQQLTDVLKHYPVGASLMIQAPASWEPEAGVFYVRHPEQPQGRIISLALKYTPYVVGDGQRTLQQLIKDDARAGELQHLYLQRHQQQLDTVLADGQAFKLVFSASHCRGAIFRDASEHITPQLTAEIDRLMQQLPDFHYGRLDVKFRDIDSFRQGQDIEIIEINSASSESLHIWDRNTPFKEAIKALLFQYRTLFQIGAANRKRGFRPPKLSALLAAWKKERTLTSHYPETD